MDKSAIFADRKGEVRMEFLKNEVRESKLLSFSGHIDRMKGFTVLTFVRIRFSKM